MTQPLFLIGPRGCGKTRSEWPLPIRLTVGLSIPISVAITAQYDGRGDRRKGRVGGFRARETAALEAVTAPSTVIAQAAALF